MHDVAAGSHAPSTHSRARSSHRASTEAVACGNGRPVTAEGGAATTNSKILDHRLKLLRNHGLESRNESTVWGTNSRLDNLQAGFGNIMLKKISSWNKKQLNIAKKYSKNLNKKLRTPIFNLKISNPTFHQYIVRTKLRDDLKNFLNKNKIDTAIHYPIPIHKQIAYKKQFGDTKLPNTEKFSKEILSLPINPYMTANEVNFVIKKVNEFFEIR